MNITKDKSLFRIITAGGVLLLYLAFVLTDVFILRDEYMWNHGRIIGMVLRAFPFVSLFVVAVFEKFSKSLNRRTFVYILFLLLSFFYWQLFLVCETYISYDFRFLSTEMLGDYTLIDNMVFVFTCFVAVLIPISGKALIKTYCLVMEVLHLFAFGFSIYGAFSGDTASLLSLFYAAIGFGFCFVIYNFKELLTEDNVYESGLWFWELVGRPIFGRRYASDVYDEDDDFNEMLDGESEYGFDAESESYRYEDHHGNFRKMFLYALNEQNGDVLESLAAIEKLSENEVEGVMTFDKDKVVAHYERILEYGRKLCELHENYRVKEQLDAYDELVAQRDEKFFMRKPL